MISSWAYVNDTSEILINNEGIALKGFDPVSYFAEKVSRKGISEYSFRYKHVLWYFVDSTNLNVFKKNPEKYISRFGGFCAYGVKFGRKVVTDPRIFTIYGGKLYINLNKRVNKIWNKRRDHNIKKANKKWGNIKKKKVK